MIQSLKYILLTLITCMLTLTASAQKEEDFASRYMTLYAQGTSLECTTLSPDMMELILGLPSVEGNGLAKELLSQLKSIRVVKNSAKAETAKLFGLAHSLAQKNAKRYKLFAEEDDKQMYIRRHDGKIVEIVMFMHNEHFQMLNVTGNISESFLQQVLKI